MILEEKLTVLRKQHGYSQEELADKLDVSRQAVYKWESGQAKPDISKLQTISSLYNVSIDNLLNDKQDIIPLNQNNLGYGEVVNKKVLDDNAADNDNLKLFPEEAKKLKIRKIALLIGNILSYGFLALTVIFFFSAAVSSLLKLM